MQIEYIPRETFEGSGEYKIYTYYQINRLQAFLKTDFYEALKARFPIIATHPPETIIVTDGYVYIKVLFFGIVKRERILNNIGCLNIRSAKVPEHIFYLAEVCPDNIDQIANQVI